MRRLSLWALASFVGLAAACGGGGSPSTPASPTAAAPTAPVAAEYTISVTVGSRPARALIAAAIPQATGRSALTIDIVERRSVQGEVRRIVATLRKGNQAVFTETLDDIALRALVSGGELTIPGGGRLSIPYTPRFPFTRDDQLTAEVQGEFRDAFGNTSTPASTPVPVPVDNVATCVADPNHLCLNNQRFQVDVLVNGARVTTMRRENDTDGRYEFEELVLIAKVLNACGLNSRYRVELAVNAARLPFTVFVTDTLAGLTKSYLTGSPSTPVIDEAFATCP